MHPLHVAALLLLTTAPPPLPAPQPPPPAAAGSTPCAVLDERLACVEKAWAAWARHEATDFDGLNRLVDGLFNATGFGAGVDEESPCFQTDVADELIAACESRAFETFEGMALGAGPWSVRLGALLALHGAIDSEVASPSEAALLTRVTRSLLDPKGNPSTRAGALRVLALGRVSDLDVMDVVVERAADPELIVRVSALQVILRSTGCPLMRTWSSPSDATDENVRAVQAWWRTESASLRQERAAPAGGKP